MNPISALATPPNERPAVQDHAVLDLIRWQRRMLPFMTVFVVATATAFFCFSGVLLYEVTTFIEADSGQDIRLSIQSEIAKTGTAAVSPEDVTDQSLLLLEADALSKRYREANALLLSRIWSRQLAFITGMVLAFVGAVFILGKLSESASQISGGAKGWQVGISSASPGIILSFFGTILLVSALYSQATLDVSDGPAYVNILRQRSHVTGSSTDASTKSGDPSRPLDLKQLQGLGQQKSPPVQKSK
jgi:hypothetical protein